jgi:ADP-ribose pyrophosphatase YjhB (NUDIX family)
VLVVNQNGNSWSLPKGHIDPGESARQAAEREIREESGVSQLDFIKHLGDYERFRIGLDGREETAELKHITMYLYRTNQLELQPEDPDNPEARWVKPDEVADLLTHPKDKAFFESHRNQLAS